jgi:hypothetical protein
MARRSRARASTPAAVVGRIVIRYKGMDWVTRNGRYAMWSNPYASLIRSAMSPCELLCGTLTGAEAPVIIVLPNKMKRQRLLTEFGFVFSRR